VDLVLLWLRLHLGFLAGRLDLEFLEDLGFPVDLDFLWTQLLLVSLVDLELLAGLLDLFPLALLEFLVVLVNP
jgi:hypothetical protein